MQRSQYWALMRNPISDDAGTASAYAATGNKIPATDLVTELAWAQEETALIDEIKSLDNVSKANRVAQGDALRKLRAVWAKPGHGSWLKKFKAANFPFRQTTAYERMAEAEAFEKCLPWPPVLTPKRKDAPALTFEGSAAPVLPPAASGPSRVQENLPLGDKRVTVQVAIDDVPYAEVPQYRKRMKAIGRKRISAAVDRLVRNFELLEPLINNYMEESTNANTELVQ
jgi:hypothetical protein